MEEAINYLELVGSDRSVLLDVLPDLPQDGQHGHVRFSGTGGSAKQDVLVRVETDFGQLALNPVQLFEALKRALSVRRQRFNRDQLKRIGKNIFLCTSSQVKSICRTLQQPEPILLNLLALELIFPKLKGQSDITLVDLSEATPNWKL